MQAYKTTRWTFWPVSVAVWVAVCLPGVVHAQETAQNPLRIVLGREHGDRYTGGRTVDVLVRIGAANWEGITAMGLYERIPDGWTLEDVRLVGGVPPSVSPEPKSTGVLQFIWILPPRAPVSMRYTLRVPPQDSGVRSFSGQVEYRLGGGKLTSNVALSQLDGIADELPVVTLRGDASMTVDQYAAFEDPGATATDAEDGDLSARVQVAGQVDTSEAGEYTLTYGVLDSVGNRAEPVTRVVTVAPIAGGPAAGDSPGRPRAPARPPAHPVRARPPGSAAADKTMPAAGALLLPEVVNPGLESGDNPFSLPLNGDHTKGGTSSGDPIQAPGAGSVRNAAAAGSKSAERIADALVSGSGPEGGRPQPSTAPGPGRKLAMTLACGMLGLVAAGCWTASRGVRRRNR